MALKTVNMLLPLHDRPMLCNARDISRFSGLDRLRPTEREIPKGEYFHEAFSHLKTDGSYRWIAGVVHIARDPARASHAAKRFARQRASCTSTSRRRAQRRRTSQVESFR